MQPRSTRGRFETVPLAVRFAAKVRVLESGCHEWMGARSGRYGYGEIRVNGKCERAHRIALVLIGVTITADTIVLHRCNNKWCVNVEHLQPGTQSENMKHWFDGKYADPTGAVPFKAASTGGGA